MNETIKTALYDTHLQLKAKIVPFGSFLLPVWYSTLKEEHMAVRQSSGCFDISHMGIFEIEGEHAETFLQRMTCNDARKTANGLMIYSMILNHEGGIKDDVMFGKIDNRYIMIVNASNREKIMNWCQNNNDEDVMITEKNHSHSMIAIQGPHASKVLSEVIDKDLSSLKAFSISSQSVFNEDIILLRTGYTGEDGFECIVPHHIVENLWTSLIEKGVTPCGLGARDSLRLEKGLPLYGQELNEDITPFMTRYKWVVKMDTVFIGKGSLEKKKEEKNGLVSVGIEMIDRVIPRPHYPIVEGGEITSGTLSPTLDKPIGLAFVPKHLSEKGNTVHVTIRNKPCAARIVSVPFK